MDGHAVSRLQLIHQCMRGSTLVLHPTTAPLAELTTRSAAPGGQGNVLQFLGIHSRLPFVLLATCHGQCEASELSANVSVTLDEQ